MKLVKFFILCGFIGLLAVAFFTYSTHQAKAATRTSDPRANQKPRGPMIEVMELTGEATKSDLPEIMDASTATYLGSCMKAGPTNHLDEQAMSGPFLFSEYVSARVEVNGIPYKAFIKHPVVVWYDRAAAVWETEVNGEKVYVLYPMDKTRGL